MVPSTSKRDDQSVCGCVGGLEAGLWSWKIHDIISEIFRVSIISPGTAENMGKVLKMRNCCQHYHNAG